MNESNLDEIEDILTRIDEQYNMSAQDVAIELHISPVHLSRVRHGSYGDKAEKSLLTKLRNLAEEYGLFEEPDPQIAQEQKAQLQLARAMERDSYHPALIQASYRRFGLDSTALSWASLFMGQDRLNDIMVQLATKQYVVSQQSRKQSQIRAFAQPKPVLQLPQPRTRQRIQEPSQPLQIEAPKQQVTVSEVSQQETLQSFYNELFEHRK